MSLKFLRKKNHSLIKKDRNHILNPIQRRYLILHFGIPFLATYSNVTVFKRSPVGALAKLANWIPAQDFTISVTYIRLVIDDTKTKRRSLTS